MRSAKGTNTTVALVAAQCSEAALRAHSAVASKADDDVEQKYRKNNLSKDENLSVVSKGDPNCCVQRAEQRGCRRETSDY